ncbi:MAG: hypothetical protein JHC33_12000 [Ignisphaera sp.]|nr:hypothetical protein [Ignisphaera sp.]
MNMFSHLAIVLLALAYFHQNKVIVELKEQVNKPKTINVVLPKSSFGELEQIPKNHRAMVVAIAMTESNCNYAVRHPDKDTIGIGGIKPNQWDLQCKVNSLQAIDEIITQLEDKGKSPYEIIKFYKGAKKNIRSTEQCYDLYLRLRNIL